MLLSYKLTLVTDLILSLVPVLINLFILKKRTEIYCAMTSAKSNKIIIQILKFSTNFALIKTIFTSSIVIFYLKWLMCNK